MTTDDANAPPATRPAPQRDRVQAVVPAVPPAREYGGPKGLEPTRYGDWERKGRCVDF